MLAVSGITPEKPLHAVLTTIYATTLEARQAAKSGSRGLSAEGEREMIERVTQAAAEGAEHHVDRLAWRIGFWNTAKLALAGVVLCMMGYGVGWVQRGWPTTTSYQVPMIRTYESTRKRVATFLPRTPPNGFHSLKLLGIRSSGLSNCPIGGINMSGQTTAGTSQTSGSPSGSSQGARLSQAIDIEYKAFTRSFMSGADNAAVLFLMASCWHTTNGFSLYVEKDGDNYKLMEQPPTGIFLNLHTYYSASWPTQGISFEADQIPKHVTITDARGDHSIAVHRWT